MPRPNDRLSEIYSQANTQELPNKPVDIGDIEPGTDGGLVDAIDEANEQAVIRGHALEDTEHFRAIGDNLQESAFLALESIYAETGLHAQTLMAMEYGINQHLSAMNTSLAFPSLESETVTDFQKTCWSLEQITDKIQKIWEATAAAAKRAATAARGFMARMFDLQTKVTAKVTTLRQQLQNIDEAAKGNIDTSAAKRLAYGDNNFNQFVPTMVSVLTGMTAYADEYKQSALKDIQATMSALTATDAQGIPTANPEMVRTLLSNEASRRAPLLQLGYGSAPRPYTNESHGVDIVTSYSKALPGGFHFASSLPVMNNKVSAGGKVIDALPDATLDIEAWQGQKVAKQIPVLSVADGIKLCDAVLAYCEQMNAAVDASEGVYEALGTDHIDFRKMEKALADSEPLSADQLRLIEENPEFMATLKKNTKFFFGLLGNVVATSASGAALSEILGGGNNKRAIIVAFTTAGKIARAWTVPTLIATGVFTMFTYYYGKESTEAVIKTSDPNAPMLHILRSLSHAGSMMPSYATSGPSTVMDYFSKIIGPLLDYVSDSAKAHVKAAGQSPSAEPAAA